MLVAPALPTNDPQNSWSTGGGLGRKLRFAAVRAILQVSSSSICTQMSILFCMEANARNPCLDRGDIAIDCYFLADVDSIDHCHMPCYQRPCQH